VFSLGPPVITGPGVLPRQTSYSMLILPFTHGFAPVGRPSRNWHTQRETVGLFSGLSDDQLQRLIDISREEVFHDGDIIFEQGADGDKLYFVSEGQVEIRIRSFPDGPERSEIYSPTGRNAPKSTWGADRFLAKWP